MTIPIRSVVSIAGLYITRTRVCVMCCGARVVLCVEVGISKVEVGGGGSRVEVGGGGSRVEVGGGGIGVEVGGGGIDVQVRRNRCGNRSAAEQCAVAAESTCKS